MQALKGDIDVAGIALISVVSILVRDLVFVA